MSTYNVKYTDNEARTPIEIEESDVDNSTDLTLFGRKKLQYGQRMNEQLLNLLENFACPEDSGNPGNPDLTVTIEVETVPRLTNPVTGQVWFNTTQNVPFFWDGEAWIPLTVYGEIGANWGIIGHGSQLPLPISPSGYAFTYAECSWVVGPFNFPQAIDFMDVHTNATALVTSQYSTKVSAGLTNGYANYLIVGIRGNVNLGTTSPVPSPTPSPQLTVTPTPTITITPSITPTSGLSPTPTPTLTPTVTTTKTPTPTPTRTPTPTPSVGASASPTPSPIPSPTPSNTPTNTPSNTPTNTPSNTPSPVALSLNFVSSDPFGNCSGTNGTYSFEVTFNITGGTAPYSVNHIEDSFLTSGGWSLHFSPASAPFIVTNSSNQTVEMYGSRTYGSGCPHADTASGTLVINITDSTLSTTTDSYDFEIDVGTGGGD